MTVQQEQPTAVAEPTTSTRAELPEQRGGEHDRQPEQAQQPAAPALRGWGSAEDRRMAQWLMVLAVSLGLYLALFIALGARVW